jgi:hypothetical protein
MKKSKRFTNSLGTIIISLAAIGVVVSVIALFFPRLITGFSEYIFGFSEYTGNGGKVNPQVVRIQAIAYNIFVSICIAFWGIIMTIFYYDESKVIASSIAVGVKKKGRIRTLAILIAVNFILFGIYLPRDIFNPTHMETLNQSGILAAAVVKSKIAGGISGFAMFLGACAVAWGLFYIWVQLFPKKTLKKFEVKMKVRSTGGN